MFYLEPLEAVKSSFRQRKQFTTKSLKTQAACQTVGIEIWKFIFVFKYHDKLTK